MNSTLHFLSGVATVRRFSNERGIVMTFLKTLLAAALAVALPAQAAGEASLAHQDLPGITPVPITEGAGLKTPEDLEAFFDGIMSAHLQAQHCAGATVSVVKDGKLFFAKGYGFADVEKQEPVIADRTLFRPGSVSKLFTWTAIMQLVEQGKLSLDADVNQYSDVKLPATYAQPVTLRNLMTHTEGFEDGGIGWLFANKADNLLPLVDTLKKHMPHRVRPPTTDFADGTNSSYSNWGTALAGHIIATVSGESFDDYVAKHIFQPLGMDSSTFGEPLPPPLASRMSTGYQYKNGAFKTQGFEFIHAIGPAGSLSSTSTDMAKFMIAHLNDGEFAGQRILKAETAQLMHARALSPNPYVDGAALGFYEVYMNGRRLISHAGDTVAFHSDLFLLPGEKVGLYVSYNTAPTLLFSARTDLMKAFMQRYYPAKLPAVKPPADFDQRAAKYAGSYRTIRHAYTTNEAAFGLLGDEKVALTADHTLALAGGTASQWVEVAPNTFRERDSDRMIAFAEKDGRITHLMDQVLVFIPSYKVAFLESMPLHAGLIGLGLLCFIGAIVTAVRTRRADAPRAARGARWLAAAAGLVNLVFLVLLVLTFSGEIDELIYAWPPVFKAALAFPLIAIPLTLAMLWLAVRAWREGWWTGWARARYTVVALLFAAFLWSLNFMNLVGYKFS
ncbi:MAG TPA: serine hydrolase domain-containing protein [Candidatus Binatia bacterium]|nr:serine hydrolase domain-containing protein [Candidatus Binatia bacterium]